MARIAFPAAAVLLLAACQKPETPEQMQARMAAEADSARAQIEQATARFSQFISAGQADSVATLYAENGTLMAPNMPLVMGRDNIRTAFAGMLSGGQFVLNLRPEAVTANGPVAIERGAYTIQFTPGEGNPMPAEADTGKYIVHWHKTGGTWYIVDDIWNSDRPLPTPAPAAGARRRT